MTTPLRQAQDVAFVTVNIGAPPTIHQACSVQDLLAASDALREFALSLKVQPSAPETPSPNGKVAEEAAAWQEAL